MHRARADPYAPAPQTDQMESDVDDDVRLGEVALEIVAGRALEGQYGRHGPVEPPEHVGHAIRPAPAVAVVDCQNVRPVARLTPFIYRCKLQSLSITSAEKPPVATGPQPVISSRSTDFPCRVIAV